MAQVIGAIVGALAGALTAVGVPSVVATAAAQVIVGAGLSLASSQFTKQPRLSMPDQQSVLNQSTAGRVRGYGRAKLGGTRAFWDSKDGTLYQIVMHHSGEVDGIEAIYLGDHRPTIADAWVTGDDAIPEDTIKLLTRLGTSGQTAFQAMIDAWPGVWTADHRLRGIACTYAEFRGVKAEKFSAVYPEGAQTEILALARLSKVYDPRDGTFGWSQNSGLAIADFLASDDGFPGIAAADVDWTSFGAFAGICDGPVPLKGGGTQPRYRLGGVYGMQDDPVDVLGRLQATCDADLYLTAEGKIGIRGGVWEAPTVTITDRDILAFDLAEGNDKLAAFNELKILFRDPVADYQPNEAPRWRNTVDQAERGEIVADLTLDFVQWPAQAQRLAKIHAARENPAWRGTVSTNLVGLRAWDQRLVRLVIPELHIDGAFYIERRALRADLTGLDFEVFSLDASAYEWSPASEEGVPSPAPADTRPSKTVEVPVVSTLTSPVRTVGGTTGHVLQLVVVAPARSGLDLDAQFRVSPSGPWEAMPGDDLTAVSGIVGAGTYSVRARWKTSSTVTSEWSTSATITVA